MIPLDTHVILRHDIGYPYPVAADRDARKYLDYALWTGSSWQLLRLDIGLGTCLAGPVFASLHETCRAYRAGIRWEG